MLLSAMKSEVEAKAELDLLAGLLALPLSPSNRRHLGAIDYR